MGRPVNKAIGQETLARNENEVRTGNEARIGNEAGTGNELGLEMRLGTLHIAKKLHWQHIGLC